MTMPTHARRAVLLGRLALAFALVAAWSALPAARAADARSVADGGTAAAGAGTRDRARSRCACSASGSATTSRISRSRSKTPDGDAERDHRRAGSGAVHRPHARHDGDRRGRRRRRDADVADVPRARAAAACASRSSPGLARRRRARRRQPKRARGSRRARASSSSAASRASSSSSRTTASRSSTCSTSSTRRARRSIPADRWSIDLPEVAVGAGTMQGSSSLASLQGNRLRHQRAVSARARRPVQVGFPRAVPRRPRHADADVAGRVRAAVRRRRKSRQPADRVAAVRAAAGGERERHAVPDGHRRPHQRRRHADAEPERPAAPQPRVRDVGVGLGIIMLLVGLWAGFTAPAAPDEATRSCSSARRSSSPTSCRSRSSAGAGRIDDERYATQRESLVAQLERVMGELDRIDPATPVRAAA